MGRDISFHIWGEADRDRFQRERVGERRSQSYFDSGNGVPRNAIVRFGLVIRYTFCEHAAS